METKKYYEKSDGSRWATTEELLARSIVSRTNARTVSTPGVPLVSLSGGRVAMSPPECHVLINGTTGFGKSRRLMIPAIRMMAKGGESMVISDPKGELYRNTASVLEKKYGYRVRVINYRNPDTGCRWNPLKTVEEGFRSGVPEKREKALQYLKQISEILVCRVSCDRDKFWENAAADLLLASAKIILQYTTDKLTFRNIADVAGQLTMMEDDKKNNGIFSEILEALPKDDILRIRQTLSGFYKGATNTVTSIAQVFNSMLAPMTDSAAVMDQMEDSDFDITEVGKEATALYLILPDDSDVMYAVASMLVTQLYSSLVELADGIGGRLPNRVTFLLDEFGSFVRIPQFASILTASRSRGIRFVLACQNLNQLRARYDVYTADVIESNCRVLVCMNTADRDFISKVQMRLGSMVLPYTQRRVPLLESGDFQTFGAGDVLIMNDTCRPFMGHLEDFGNIDFGDDGMSLEAAFPQKREPKRPRPVFLADILYEIRQHPTGLPGCDVVDENHEDITSVLRDLVDACDLI